MGLNDMETYDESAGCFFSCYGKLNLVRALVLYKMFKKGFDRGFNFNGAENASR
jgi:hypothetical protein